MVNPKSQNFLFIGSDGYSKEKALKQLTSSILDASSKELNCTVFYAPESDAGKVLDCIATAPFLADRRLVVVKNFEKASKDFRAKIITYMKSPSKSACLVLETLDDSILEEAGVSGNATVRMFGSLRDHDLGSWIKDYVKKAGKNIEDEAVEDLKEIGQGSLLLLSGELDKLSSFTGERKDIKAKDVSEIVGRSVAASSYDLTDAIGSKDIKSAMRIVSDLLISGKKHYEVLGLLCWHFKRILRAKSLKQRGESESRIAAILKIGRRYANDFFLQADSMDMAQAKSKMNVLLEADLDIKRTKYDPTLILEFAIIRLCLG